MLMWTPLLLVIEPGNMAQVLCLFVQEFSLSLCWTLLSCADPPKNGDRANQLNSFNHEFVIEVEVAARERANYRIIPRNYESLPNHTPINGKLLNHNPRGMIQ